MDYYDLDTILAEEEKMPVTFIYPAWQLGFLDPGSGEEHLRKGSKVEIPFWLSKALFTNKWVFLDAPKLYGKKMRGTLNADASVINLQQAPYFYFIGTQIAILHRDNDLTDLFPVAFRNRYQVVVKHSSNLLHADTFDFTRKLAAVERKMFDSGRSVFRDFEQWKRRKTDQLTNTSLLDTSSTPGRKRRRNEIAKS